MWNFTEKGKKLAHISHDMLVHSCISSRLVFANIAALTFDDIHNKMLALKIFKYLCIRSCRTMLKICEGRKTADVHLSSVVFHFFFSLSLYHVPAFRLFQRFGFFCGDCICLDLNRWYPNSLDSPFVGRIFHFDRSSHASCFGWHTGIIAVMWLYRCTAVADSRQQLLLCLAGVQ